MGFDEKSPENVKNNIIVDGVNLTSKVNGKSYQFGTLEVPTLESLIAKAPLLDDFNSEISVSEVVGDIQELHMNPENENALFQAASQFNLLEMAGPLKTPELGVDIYDYDYTQGPACAVACGAGTIYRNYFADVNGQVGQSVNNQINCLRDLELKLQGNWSMVNGYALISQDELVFATNKITGRYHDKIDELKGKLRIGLQWDTQVTYQDSNHLVSQAYCSALPVAYCNIRIDYWESLARLILEATYEATLYSALINIEKTGCNKVFLTLVGGGAFGNDLGWIFQSLLKTLQKFKNTPLDVKIVSYNHSSPLINQMIPLI